MLAQRWEKPSTDQEERRAILRARKLCGEKANIAKAFESEGASSVSQLQEDGSRGGTFFNQGRTFISISWILGVRPTLVTKIFESVPTSFMNAISFLENTLNLVQRPIPQFGLTAFAAEHGDHISLIYRWDPNTMERTCVEGSSEFFRSIAGMQSEEFFKMVESDKLSLPCSQIQYLCYFLDGALCMGEGLTSWTRSLKYDTIHSL